MSQRRRRARLEDAPSVASTAQGATKSDINVTPLVDVVLVLLIIFMVVTPLLHRGVPLELPETEHHEKKQDTGEQLIVSVRADGTYVEADKLEKDQLTTRLRDELKRAGRPVHIRADRTLRFGDVRAVLDQLHQLGAENIGMGTAEKGQ